MDTDAKKNIGLKIKELRTNHGQTQDVLAALLNTTQQAIGRWENGLTMPDLDTFFRICDIYHVQDILATFGYVVPGKDAPLSAESLDVARRYEAAPAPVRRAVLSVLELQAAPQEEEPLKLTKIVPLLGQRFAAGTGEPDGDMFLEDYETDDLRAEFAIHVNGDSMEPYLPDGSIALGVRREPQDGETGAFFLDGAFYVKQFCSDSEGNVYLFSLNRSRSDADVTVFAAADRSLQLVGTILLQKLPLPD